MISATSARLAHWFTALAIGLVGVAAPTPAFAGTITGKVLLPKQKQAPPVRSTGFVRRKANPIAPTRPYDPRPEMIVILAGEIPDEAKTPSSQPAEYKLLGESFEYPLFPVHVGQTVRLINKGRNSPHLRSKQAKSVGRDCSPLNPTVNCDLKLTKEFQVVEITAQGNPHLRAQIVGVGHKLFSRIDKNGKYTIENVPPGAWEVRVRYDGEWIGKTDVTVPKRRGRRNKAVTAPTYQLPDDLGKKKKKKKKKKKTKKGKK